jgi:hypothetical protein
VNVGIQLSNAKRYPGARALLGKVDCASPRASNGTWCDEFMPTLREAPDA